MSSIIPSAIPISGDEAAVLLAPLASAEGILLAVSGGADSTALLLLAAEWAATQNSMRVFATTVDHGLREGSAAEAERVGALAANLGVAHQVLRWTGPKPATGIEEAARTARYDLLAEFAAREGLTHLATAHTLDDQAETVLMRLAAGSGPAGLAGMRAESRRGKLVHARPFLGVPKARLVATCEARGVEWSEDAMNADPRFARPRLRAVREILEREGLSAERLGVLAARMGRITDAVDKISAAAWPDVVRADGGRTVLDGAALLALPEEIGLRLLLRAIAVHGDQAPDRLNRAEDLFAAVRAAIAADGSVVRTLAGARVELWAGEVRVSSAPPRRKSV